jgi:hypothetical protein
MLTKEHFVSARTARDRSIVAQLRILSESEQCADMHASLGRLNELQRPACVDAATWAAWKRRDRHVLSQVLEARMEQGRDLSKGGSPALLVGVAKFEAALKACDKIGAANCEGMGDCVDLAVEVLLWMVDACELVANAGHGEDNIASCKVRRIPRKPSVSCCFSAAWCERCADILSDVRSDVLLLANSERLSWSNRRTSSSSSTRRISDTKRAETRCSGCRSAHPGSSVSRSVRAASFPTCFGFLQGAELAVLFPGAGGCRSA